MPLKRLDSVKKAWNPLELSPNEVLLADPFSDAQELIYAHQSSLDGLGVVVLL